VCDLRCIAIGGCLCHVNHKSTAEPSDTVTQNATIRSIELSRD
jgi:hypothetical protein